MLITSQPADWNQRDSARVEKRGPSTTTTVPPSRTGMPSSRAVSTRSARSSGQKGSAADPYCPLLRRVLVETARSLEIPVRDGGTVVTIQGPRFATRAESRWYASLGEVINMTAYPEGHLARELELCYANVSTITDHDVGVEGQEPVSAETVVRVFEENNARLRELLFAAIPKIPRERPEHLCSTALRGARVARPQ